MCKTLAERKIFKALKKCIKKEKRVVNASNKRVYNTTKNK